MLATALLAGCTLENDIMEQTQPTQGEEIESIKVSARNFIGAEEITRTSVEVGDDGATFVWAENDTIGIFPDTGYQVAFPMQSGAGSQTAEFDGGGWALKASSQYAAYYPFAYENRSGKNIAVTYTGQLQKGNGNTAHIGQYDYMSAAATTPAEGSVTFDFQHLGTLVQWKLKVPAAGEFTSLTLKTKEHLFIRKGKIDLTSSKHAIESSDKATSFSMELQDISTTAAGQEITVYMMMAPTDLSGQSYTLSLTNSEGKMAEAVLEGQKFEAGKAYALTVELGKFEDAVLEIADKRGKAIGSEGGTVTLEYLTNSECQFIVSDDAKEWITLAESRAVTSHKAAFNIAENTGEKNRRGIVTIKCKHSNLAVEYIILQGGVNTYAITEEGGNIPVGILSSNKEATSAANGLKNLVDNNLNTYFEANGNSQVHIDWEGPYAIAIKGLELAVNSGGYGISWWSLHASANGKDYNGFGWLLGMGQGTSTYLHTKDDIKARSQYFRIVIESNHGASTTRVSELGYIEDMEADKDITTFEQLLARGTSFTKDASTPMGNHYANKHVTTDADRTWLATATNEPDLLPSAGGYTLRKYEVNLYPYEKPVPADINQHGVGDCSALAVFAEMAYLFPEFIQSIITDHKDGTYTVAMYDPQGEPVDVTVQSTFLGDDNGIGASSGKDGKANWATIMEKAIMKWNKIYQVNPDINGIGSEHVAPLFTGEGNSFAISPGSLLPEQLEQAVNIALDNRMIVIGGFTTPNLSVNGPLTVTAHAYSFMYSNMSGAMFAMRNPWGNSPQGTRDDDGILNIINDGVVPPTIDLRIIYPGAAKEFAVKNLTPYIPPQY